MNGGVIPHHQQPAYDKGRQAGFEAGAEYGRRLQKMQDELKPVIGFAFGVLVSVIVYMATQVMMR